MRTNNLAKGFKPANKMSKCKKHCIWYTNGIPLHMVYNTHNFTFIAISPWILVFALFKQTTVKLVFIMHFSARFNYYTNATEEVFLLRVDNISVICFNTHRVK